MTPAERRNVIWGKDIGLGQDHHVMTTMTCVDPPPLGFRAGRESGLAIDVPVFLRIRSNTCSTAARNDPVSLSRFVHLVTRFFVRASFTHPARSTGATTRLVNVDSQ